jgi:hypothetical protein
VTALPKGQYVKHYRYGFGLITRSDDEETAVEFELHGLKKFVTSLMELDLSDLTPPAQFRSNWVKQPPLSKRNRQQTTGRARLIRDADKGRRE